MIDKSQVLKIIDEESEYPTPFTDEQFEKFKKHIEDYGLREVLQMMLQSAVAKTKESLKNKIGELN